MAETLSGEGLLRNRSLITWAIIFAILLGSGLLTIMLPALLGGETLEPLPREASTVTITPPIPIAGQDSFTIPSWAVMLGLAFLVPALVIGAGLTLALISILISRFVTRAKAEPEYREAAAALDKRYADRVAAMRETRPTSKAPETTWKRWAVITTALSILMFVGFGALLIASFVFPAGQLVTQDRIINVTMLVLLGALLLALIIMAFTLRGDRLTAPDRSGTMPIPWDFVAVVVTGLLVVGLGIAVIAIINAPR
jgi:hypothetical protein